MTDRMSAADYLKLMAQQGTAKGKTGGGGRMLRLPASFLEGRGAAPAPAAQAPAAGVKGTEAPAPAAKTSSAAKARERVFETITALEQARAEVEYTITPEGEEHVVIRVMGGETLPPNRAANIGREQAKASQRTFSRYKHACGDRMADAAMLLRVKVKNAGRQRFNAEFKLTRITYQRQVPNRKRLLDEDAVAYSFKYILDGLVANGVLVDDSRKYVRLGDATQSIGEAMLVIELTTGGQ